MAHILFHRFYDAGEPLKSFIKDTGNPYTIPEATALKIIGDLCEKYGEIEVSLDDGYKDALEFLKNHHSKFPKLKWYVFICPKRVLEKTNHAWDHKWTEEFLLADKDLIHEVAKLPRVAIGCHTNEHLELASLSDIDLTKELSESFEDFKTLTQGWGVGDKVFAFPFGTPNLSYDTRVLNAIKKYTLGYKLFSTESLWEGVGERGVLPRIGILDESCESRQKSWEWFDQLTQQGDFKKLN